LLKLLAHVIELAQYQFKIALDNVIPCNRKLHLLRLWFTVWRML